LLKKSVVKRRKDEFGMAKQTSAAPPQEALPDAESNRYLAKVKASLCKRWSLSRMETLYEIADLAMYLWALERPREAVAVAGTVAVAIAAPPPLPRGRVNYNVWCPATYSHALVAYLGASRMPELARASREALLADAGIARDNPDYLASKVTEARQRTAAPPDPKSMKWDCVGLARSLGGMVLYAELAAAGDPLFAPYASDAASLIPQLLSKLGARLQAK
jgi:hypothetical protein